MVKLEEYLQESVTTGKKKYGYNVTMKTTTGGLAELLNAMGFKEYTDEPLMNIVKETWKSKTPMWFKYTAKDMQHSDIQMIFYITCPDSGKMYRCRFSRDSKNKPLKLSEIIRYNIQGGYETVEARTNDAIPDFLIDMNADIQGEIK